MGEIADMMLDGILDEWTGEYIGPIVGHPRSRDPEHWSNQNKKDNVPVRYNSKTGLPSKACVSNGVYKWLRSKYWPGSGENTANSTREDGIISRYGREVLNTEQRPRVIANIISKEHWEPFMKWVKETYK